MEEKIYLVRTTTNDRWEFCQGAYLVKAKTIAQAKKTVEIPTSEEVISVVDISKIKELKKGKVFVIGTPQIE